MRENKRTPIVNNRNRNVYSRTKNTAKEDIKNQEQRKGKRLTRNQKNKIIKRNFVIAGLVAMLGIGGATLALNSGKEDKQQVETNMDELAQEVSSAEQFRNSQKQENYLTQDPEVAKEIEELNSQEVLEYIKEIYVEQYNEKNNEDITIDNVSLTKKTEHIALYKDEAKNGDTIIRNTSSYKAKEEGIHSLVNSTMILAEINTEDGLEKEMMTNYNGEYVTVYNSFEEVEQYVQNALSSVGEVMQTGVDTAISMNQQETSKEVKEDYKEKFISAVSKYKNQKQQERLTAKNQNIQQQETEDREPE